MNEFKIHFLFKLKLVDETTMPNNTLNFLSLNMTVTGSSDSGWSGGGWAPWNRSDKEETILFILSIFAMISSIISIYLTIQFFHSFRDKSRSSDMFTYFKLTMTICCMLNLIATLASSTYIIWVTNTEIPVFYALHDSHYMRTITTLSWHLSKVFIFYIFNGRLYYSFANSLYSYPKSLFIGLDIFVPLLLIISLSISLPYAYLPDLTPDQRQKQGIGYNVFRITFIILTLWLLLLFNKRLFQLFAFTQKVQPTVEMIDSSSNINKETNTTVTTDLEVQTDLEIVNKPPQSPSHDSQPSQPSPSSPSGSNFESVGDDKCDIAQTSKLSLSSVSRRTIDIGDDGKERKENFFMEILIKNSILWIIVCFANVITGTIYHFGLNFWFVFNEKGIPNEVSLAFPLLIQGIDSWVNTLCIFLSCSFGAVFYDIICKCRKPPKCGGKLQKATNGNIKGCHGCCKSFCNRCAQRYS